MAMVVMYLYLVGRLLVKKVMVVMSMLLLVLVLMLITVMVALEVMSKLLLDVHMALRLQVIQVVASK